MSCLATTSRFHLPIPSSPRSGVLLRLAVDDLIASGSPASDDEVEERGGDELLDSGEVERREDAHEDGEESTGDDNDVEEHEEPPAAATTTTTPAFSAFLAGRCFRPMASLSRRRGLSG